MLTIKPHGDFKKDLQRDKLSGFYTTKDFCVLEVAIDSLANCKSLARKYKDHRLKGAMTGFRECHVKPDWLLVYKIDIEDGILYLARLGTHNQIFNK